MGLEKGFQWAGFGGRGGGLVGVEVPPPPSLEDPTDTSFSSTAQLDQTDQAMDLYSFGVKHVNVKKLKKITLHHSNFFLKTFEGLK